MGLFNKNKLTLDEILKAIKELSKEEKAQVKSMMEEEPKVEETTEGVEEVSVNEEQGKAETKPEGELKEYNDFEETEGEEVQEASVETNETEGVEEQPVEETQAQPEMNNDRTNENQAEVLQGVVSRLESIEEQIAQLNELKELMETFTKKQADSFGYKGAVPGAKKDINEMSAKELKEKMLNGEI